MNNITIANETMKITKNKEYESEGRLIHLPDIDFEEVVVISPQVGEELLNTELVDLYKTDDGQNENGNSNDAADKVHDSKMCHISVTTEDSFQAGRRLKASKSASEGKTLVMNFANAHNPGGGFRLGANAQEEALCRCSTLYASITSKKASEMYKYNNTHFSQVESDYMLFSPKVCVFRDETYQFLEEPVVLGVVTIAAPNRYGAALLASAKLLKETMMRRIRIMLREAVKEGYRNLVLGAWGCGAFGNKPREVSKYFREILLEEGYGKYFDEICFAIYGKEDGKNICAFRETFS